MKALDIVGTAIGNTFRSKLRTTLTVIAIFIGAFTLTITNGLGTGINRYIDDTVAALGAGDVLSVSVAVDATTGPQEYDPDSSTVEGGRGVGELQALSDADIAAIEAVPGITSVEPVRAIAPDYVEIGSGAKYDFSVSTFLTGTRVELAAGDQLDSGSTESQLILPDEYLEPLGFSDAADAVGQTASIGITSAAGEQSVLDATIVGVSTPGLLGGGGANANDALTSALYAAQTDGLPDDQKDQYASASASFDASDAAHPVAEIESALSDLGYDSATLADRLGTLQTVITGIIGVLNAFAVIALLAAGFGIINTLLMSVQERTREIGLMKAMGMSAGRVFGLFSTEAVYIGFLGSAIGSAVGILIGSLVSGVLAQTVLKDLSGLQLIAFDPVSIAVVILLVMLIAFLAGTLPAIRAARQNPIDALRYE